jgi:hypothetical protein
VEVKAPGSVTWKTPKGQTLGKGAGTLEVPAGVKSLVAVNASTGGRTTVPVTGNPISYIKLPMGQLSIKAFPYAEVKIGSKALGMTPFPKRSLTAGTYKVTFDYEGEKKTETVTIKKGEVANVKVIFKAK